MSIPPDAKPNFSIGPQHEVRNVRVELTRQDNNNSFLPAISGDSFAGRVDEFGAGGLSQSFRIAGQEFFAAAPTYRGYSPTTPESDPNSDTSSLENHVGIWRLVGNGGEYYLMITDNLSSKRSPQDSNVTVHYVAQTREDLEAQIAQGVSTDPAARFLHKLNPR